MISNICPFDFWNDCWFPKFVRLTSKLIFWFSKFIHLISEMIVWFPKFVRLISYLIFFISKMWTSSAVCLWRFNYRFEVQSKNSWKRYILIFSSFFYAFRSVSLPLRYRKRYSSLVNRVPKCDVTKNNKFVKLWDLVPFSSKASFERVLAKFTS